MKNNKFLIGYLLLFILNIIINFKILSLQYFCSINVIFLIYLLCMKIFGKRNSRFFNSIFMLFVLLSIVNVLYYYIILIISDQSFVYSNFIMSIIHLVIYGFVFVSYFVKNNLNKVFKFVIFVSTILFVINSVCSILNIVEISILSQFCSVVLDFMVMYYMSIVIKNNS